VAIGAPVERYAARVLFNGNPYVISPATTIAAGTTAIMFVHCPGVSVNGDQYVTGVTDSKGNTWTVDHVYRPDVTGAGLNVISSRIAVAVTSGDTITITFALSGNLNRTVWIQEVTGLAASPFDQSADNNGVGTAVSTGATGALAQTDEIVFCLAGQTATQTWTKGAGFNDVTTPQIASVHALEYAIVADASPVTGTGTWGGSTTWTASVVTYKGAAAVTVTPNLAPVIYGRGAC